MKTNRKVWVRKGGDKRLVLPGKNNLGTSESKTVKREAENINPIDPTKPE